MIVFEFVESYKNLDKNVDVFLISLCYRFLFLFLFFHFDYVQIRALFWCNLQIDRQYKRLFFVLEISTLCCFDVIFKLIDVFFIYNRLFFFRTKISTHNILSCMLIRWFAFVRLSSRIHISNSIVYEIEISMWNLTKHIKICKLKTKIVFVNVSSFSEKI